MSQRPAVELEKVMASGIDLVREGLLLQASVSRLFPSSFDRDHGLYLQELRSRALLPALEDEGLKRTLRSLRIDWITLHYQTIHSIQSWEKATATQWIQVGSPMSEDLVELKGDLEVYTNAESPYIAKFNQILMQQARPLTIVFLQAENISQEEIDEQWLAVDERLAQVFVGLTSGKNSQGPLLDEEMALCRAQSPKGVDRILAKLGAWHSQPGDNSAAEIMGSFRDSCRVTLLGLRKARERFELPRMVILAPVFVGESLVGGMAFIGQPIDLAGQLRLPTELEIFLLGSLTVNALTGVRLREEKASAIQKGEAAMITTLNLAREEAVQRIAHALHTPLDSLQARVEKASELFSKANEVLAGLSQETKGLKVASQRLLAAFSTRDLQTLLEPKFARLGATTFLETLRFLNEALFQSKKLELSFQIDEEISLFVDADMLLEVMDNLLKNAARYAKTAVLICVFARREERVTIIKVKDDGPGVSGEIRKHLFEPGTSELGGGNHGFGLYYSRELMRRQGGDIKEVEPVEGAEFWVEIPHTN